MARNCHISDAFWGDEFNSKDGYKAVNKLMSDGIETCKNLSAVTRQRARYEEDFAKNLQRNFKPSDCNFNMEIGKLRDALDTFRSTGERIAAEHVAASKELSDSADRIQKFGDKLKSDWSVEKDKAKKAIDEKQKQFDKVLAAKKSYHDKSKAAEQAEVAFQFNIALPNQTPAKIDSFTKTRDRAKQDAVRAEQTYRDAVQLLDEVRDQWEKDLHRYYVYCEERNKDRIRNLQNEVWILSNIGSSTYVAAAQCCEETRVALEKVLPEADIKEFVDRNQTGTTKPAPIRFDPYVNYVISNGHVGGQSKPY